MDVDVWCTSYKCQYIEYQYIYMYTCTNIFMYLCISVHVYPIHTCTYVYLFVHMHVSYIHVYINMYKCIFLSIWTVLPYKRSQSSIMQEEGENQKWTIKFQIQFKLFFYHHDLDSVFLVCSAIVNWSIFKKYGGGGEGRSRFHIRLGCKEVLYDTDEKSGETRVTGLRMNKVMGMEGY